VSSPYDRLVKACRVSFEDANGTAHSAEVTADSLYAAVGLALEAFKAQPFAPPVPPLARLRVELRPVAVQHTVTVQQVRQWASAPARSPAEKLSKDRVRILVAVP